MTKHDGRPTPAVAYIRMSSDRQEASPDQQRAEVAKLAKRENYQIIREYFDEGISGDATEKRKAFRRMIADAEEKADFAAILCWDQDRFGRFDSIEAGRWIYPLRLAGVWLVTVAQGAIDWNDFTGRVMYGIVQEGKHQFLVDLSKNVLRGKIEAAKHGRGSAIPAWGMDRAFYDASGKLVKRVPYGEKFSKPKGWAMRFVVSKDVEAVKIVRWIFDTFATTDHGIGGIAGELNHRGVKSPKGTTWSIQTVQGILTRRVYSGANVFGAHRYGKYHHMGANGEAARGQSKTFCGEPIIIEGVHDAMVSPETFERCQRKLAARSASGRRPRYNRYLLSGVLRCGHCGGKLAGKGYSARKQPRYYCCAAGQTRPGACRRYQMPQKAIEDYVLGVLENRLLSPKAMDQIVRAIHRRAKAGTGFKDQTRALKAQIDALDRKIAKGNENLLLAASDHVADLSALLGEWKAERARLQSQLERAAANPDGQTAEKRAEMAVAELRRLRQHIKTRDPMKIRAVVHSLVEDVRLWWEPYGKRNKRFAHGVLTFRNDLQLFSLGSHGR
jgi:site-specific DNA recombinase